MTRSATSQRDGKFFTGTAILVSEGRRLIPGDHARFINSGHEIVRRRGVYDYRGRARQIL